MEQINLLPWRQTLYHKRRQQCLWSVFGVVLLLIVILVVMGSQHHRQMTYWQQKIAQLQQQQTHLQQQLSLITTAVAELTLHWEKQEKLKKEQQHNARYHQLLLFIQQNIPDSVFLTQLTLDDGNLVLQGQGITLAEIEAFATQVVKKSGATGGLTHLVQATPTQWRFVLTLSNRK